MNERPVTPPWAEAEYKHGNDVIANCLRTGRRSNPLIPPSEGPAKCRKQSKEQNLLDRLEDYDEFILAFLWAWELPFTNNEAERAFRIMKVRIKISGLLSHLGGRPRAYPNLYLYLRKQGLPVLEYLRRALDGHSFSCRRLQNRPE